MLFSDHKEPSTMDLPSRAPISEGNANEYRLSRQAAPASIYGWNATALGLTQRYLECLFLFVPRLISRKNGILPSNLTRPIGRNYS